MKPLLNTHPRAAPTIAGLIGTAMTIIFGLFEDRGTISVALESVLMGVAMYFLVKSLRDRPD